MNFPYPVLIVDDDPVHQTVVAGALKALGVREHHTASDGEDALNFLKNSDVPIGLIVLDLNMPRMDGQTFLGELKEIGYSGCVILCSGEPSVSIDIAVRLGQWFGIRVVGAMKKPLDMTVFSRMLRCCIDDDPLEKGSGTDAAALSAAL